jgi:hypothetical protein
MASTEDSSAANKLTASCHCGRVKLELPAPPTKVNECRCTICYRYGALWAYYPRDDVAVTAEDPGQQSYVREDHDEGGRGSIGFWSCKHCGCLTHWWSQPEHVKPDANGSVKMGVNTRMLPESALEGVEHKISRK